MASFIPLPESVDAQWTAGFKSVTPLNSDIRSDDGMATHELRLKGKLFWGGEAFSLYGTPEVRVNDGFTSHLPGGDIPYSDGLTLRRNLTVSSRWLEVSFRELYVEKEIGETRFRAGNQIFAWGTADLMNPTSWFNPQDLRELFLKEEDQVAQGVPALSMLRFFEEYAVEAVVMPVSISRLQSESGSFFYVMPDNFALPIRVQENEPAAATFENMGFGMRISRSVGACDLSLSFYHGPDKEPHLIPERVDTTPGVPVSVHVDSFHSVITGMGGDFSINLGDVVVQVEGAWTFDKRGYVNQDVSIPSEILFPYTVKRSGYWECSAGLNWFVPVVEWFPRHEGETVATVEVHGSGFDRDGLGAPLYSRTLAVRLQDGFWENRIPVSLAWMGDIEDDGEIVWGSIGYDFFNGVVVEASLFLFDGSPSDASEVGSPFWYLRKRDVVNVSVSWEF
ncbi:MAG: hypothetical protein MI742_18615 [Desulfobacterales bacterium]|nr:hypothetical protein [Desulfobacterales bacterium]